MTLRGKAKIKIQELHFSGARTPEQNPSGRFGSSTIEMGEETFIPACLACSANMRLRFGEKVPEHWRSTQSGLECISPQPDDQTLADVYSST